jgi:hypothetical protein
MPKIDIPEMPDVGFTFADFSSMVVEKLGPIEHLCPFKIAQIQRLIADGSIPRIKLVGGYVKSIMVESQWSV